MHQHGKEMGVTTSFVLSMTTSMETKTRLANFYSKMQFLLQRSFQS